MNSLYLTKAKDSAAFLLSDLQDAYNRTEDAATQILVEQMMVEVAKFSKQLKRLTGVN